MKQLEREKEREFYRDLMQKASNKVLDEWTENRRKRVPQNEHEFQWERKKLTQKMIIELEHQLYSTVDYKAVNEAREREEEKKKAAQVVEESKAEEKWEENREKRVSSWRDWQTLGSANKKRKLGLLRPPKVELQDSGQVRDDITPIRTAFTLPSEAAKIEGPTNK